ncbi:MAG: phosphate acetyltransferase [Candidatus Eisenbacteria bacterium]
METMAAIWDRARANAARVVLPEASDGRVVAAAAIAAGERLATPVLVGAVKEIETLGGEVEADLTGVTVVDPATSEDLGRYAGILYERRKHKGMDTGEARELAVSPLYFGALMVGGGDADGIVAGAATTTADVLRSLIRSIGSREGVDCISSAFLMVLPAANGVERAFIFADPSVVPDPDAGQLASIAVASARTMERLTGLEPVVAMLSYSTKGSASHPRIDKVIEATKIARETAPGLVIDGELQVDAAIVPDVARRKAPGSRVAGRANVLIFPNLESANIGYKLVERLAGGRAFGPILQGLARPASDLSRGCRVDDIVNTIAMTAAQKEPV